MMSASINRRRFAQSTLSVLALPWASRARAQERSAVSRLEPFQQDSFRAALLEADSQYDASVHMLKAKAASVGYHSTIQNGIVHPTRDALQYASALLASGEDERIARAAEILRQVIALQDQNPESKTYGIWSWYLEETLDQMSPPDWNWADFCGVQLLSAWIESRDLLEPSLQDAVRDSILHAGRSIQRRNMGPHYTNIAMMGTYVTMVAGERLKDAGLLDYARGYLRRLHEYVMDQGSLTEYNSPTYTIVALAELSRMRMHFQDPDDQRLVEAIHRLAWRHAADHFHPPTRQWAGPQSRCYETDLRRRPATLAFLETAIGRPGKLLVQNPLPLSLDYSRLTLACPGELRDRFFVLQESRTVVETFIKKTGPREKNVVGVTCLTPPFTYGSVNLGDFWRQRRPLLAYWGTVADPAYLQVRFLHDDYDFCSAIPLTQQNQNRSLTLVLFATDFGDTHPNLDMVKEQTIRARDLRLRFEIGGSVQSVAISRHDQPSDHFLIEDREVAVCLAPGECRFGEVPVTWQTSRKGDSHFIDAVCFQSDSPREIHLNELRKAFLSFTFSFHVKSDATLDAELPMLRREENTFIAEWKGSTKPLRLELESSLQPSPRQVIYNDCRFA